MKLIALIPARSGSKRIPGKNIRPFFGHPLIAYAIDSAKEAGIFSGIYVSSDSEEIGKISEYYGAEWIKRPAEYATDDSPDADWVSHILRVLSLSKESLPSGCGSTDPVPINAFMILRPTSPFRTVETILNAWTKWDREHCMKAIEKAKQHPEKMWKTTKVYEDVLMYPSGNTSYGHLVPTQNLPGYWIQNACIEIRLARLSHGEDLFYQPFFTEDYEGFDLNTELDWIIANVLVERQMAPWPKIERTPYGTTV